MKKQVNRIVRRLVAGAAVTGLLLGCLSGCAKEAGTSETSATAQTTAADEQESTKEVSQAVFDTTSATLTKEVTIDGDAVITGENTAFDGLGMVSANNSSRLLLDYKAEKPEAYEELLNYLFGEDGLGLELIKIEMGSDVDSSSGTEPAIKRSADEEADVTRGAGYQLASDAAKINPDIAIDMLYWGIPAWVKSAEDTYAATYQWYKETIDAMYDTYGLKVSYVTVTQNEKASDPELIKYIAKALEEESDERYDYGDILIVAGEGVCTWPIATEMLEDAELMDAIDVVTSHYTSFTTEEVKTLQEEYGKKVWFSEGSATMSNSDDTYQYDASHTGLSDINGMLDIAVRISQAITEGMTMYEFQPAIAAYYSGVTYFPKQLIVANEPWSGAYEFDAGYYMTMHFTQYIPRGWSFVDGACYGDGTTGGDGHAMVDSTYNYVTAVSEDREDYSVVLVNQSAETIAYNFTVKNLAASDKTLMVRESKGPDEDSTDYFANFYRSLGAVSPTVNEDGSATFTVVLAPYSMMSVSTLEVDDISYTDNREASEVLALNYADDFEYADYDADYLASRGNAPRYTTDQGGAFEVEEIDGNHVVMQQITTENKPSEWGSTSDPTTNLGDDRWHNYMVSADVLLAETVTNEKKTNYAGLGARYILADSNQSGYGIKLSADGTASLMKNNSAVAETALAGFDATAWHHLSLKVEENVITATVDGTELSYTDEEGVINSGRVAFYSAYERNAFDNLLVEAIGDESTITRYDDMNAILSYSAGNCTEDGEGWYFNTMCSFKNFNRTLTTGEAGDSFSFSFDGTGFALIAVAADATFTVELDGEITEVTVAKTIQRQSAYAISGLADGTHTVTVTITGGSFGMDALEVVK